MHEKLDNKDVFLTHNDHSRRDAKDSVSNVQDLQRSQEDADTRILLHVVNFGRSGLAADVIVSPDIDVFHLAMTLTSKLECPVYFKFGSKTHTEYINVKTVADDLGLERCS